MSELEEKAKEITDPSQDSISYPTQPPKSHKPYIYTLLQELGKKLTIYKEEPHGHNDSR